MLKRYGPHAAAAMVVVAALVAALRHGPPPREAPAVVFVAEERAPAEAPPAVAPVVRENVPFHERRSPPKTLKEPPREEVARAMDRAAVASLVENYRVAVSSGNWPIADAMAQGLRRAPKEAVLAALEAEKSANPDLVVRGEVQKLLSELAR
jgi:hypothetical protein